MQRLTAIIVTSLCLLLSPALLAADEVTDATRVVVISDINGRYGSTHYHQRVARAVERIIEMKPDLVISTGDMVAGQRPYPPLTQPQLQAMWHTFQTTVHDPLTAAGIPLVMTPGNHDASAYPRYQLERVVYREYLSRQPFLLSQTPDGNYPFYYRVEHGPVRLISLDATRTGALDTDQRRWLASELQRPNKYSHTLVFGHLPLQPVARGREREIVDDPALESLLAGANVSAYLSGHHHSYYPGHRIGIEMLSTGNLGGNQRALVGTSLQTGFSFTVLELLPDGAMNVNAIRGRDFSEPIAIDTLPRTIGTGEKRLQRRDLVTPGTENISQRNDP